MWTRAQLKENAKIAFQRNRWTCVGASLLVGLLGGESFGFSVGRSDTQEIEEIEEIQHSLRAFSQQDLRFLAVVMGIAGIAMLIAICYGIFLGNVITVGGRRYFMENRQHRTEMRQISWGFRSGRYTHIVKTMFVRNLYTFLWMMLFIIPGFVKSYSYLLVPYILAENPHIDTNRAISLSRKMMDGHKMEAFVLNVSFLGWEILGILTFGILNIVYVSPYMNATFGEFYAAIKAEAECKGLIEAGELPGFQKEINI